MVLMRNLRCTCGHVTHALDGCIHRDEDGTPCKCSLTPRDFSELFETVIEAALQETELEDHGHLIGYHRLLKAAREVRRSAVRAVKRATLPSKPS